jgi:hypothetical protein
MFYVLNTFTFFNGNYLRYVGLDHVGECILQCIPTLCSLMPSTKAKLFVVYQPYFITHKQVIKHTYLQKFRLGEDRFLKLTISEI